MLITIICAIQLVSNTGNTKPQNLTFHLTQAVAQDLAVQWDLDSYKSAKFKRVACERIADVNAAIQGSF